MEDLMASHSSVSPVCIAVAFWGAGAEVVLSGSRAPLRLVCNLQSGGTNPSVIRAVRAKENIEIKQIDTLHAKVFVAETGAIVSSANLSTNGLGLEGVDSHGWLEAGVLVPADSSDYVQISGWFSDIWAQARWISESDLALAEQAWQRRLAAGHSSNGLFSGDETDLLAVQTVHFEGRIKPAQRNVRSAAALVALGGHAGQPIPLPAFAFLFSGGRTRRAFESHQDKFDVANGTASLKRQFVGYFVGEDGRLTSCDDIKRRKNANDQLVEQTALWMLRRGPRPLGLEGEVVAASFSRR